jgi:hypothetical protein
MRIFDPVTKLVEKDFSGALEVFKNLVGYSNPSTLNRLLTSFFFLVLGTAQLYTPVIVRPSLLVNAVRVSGIILICVFIIISNFRDRVRYFVMKSHITSQYASDVDHGIQDALNRLGYERSEKNDS